MGPNNGAFCWGSGFLRRHVYHHGSCTTSLLIIISRIEKKIKPHQGLVPSPILVSVRRRPLAG